MAAVNLAFGAMDHGFLGNALQRPQVGNVINNFVRIKLIQILDISANSVNLYLLKWEL
jgi:hypothetical protein